MSIDFSYTAMRNEEKGRFSQSVNRLLVLKQQMENRNLKMPKHLRRKGKVWNGNDGDGTIDLNHFPPIRRTPQEWQEWQE